MHRGIWRPLGQAAAGCAVTAGCPRSHACRRNRAQVSWPKAHGGGHPGQEWELLAHVASPVECSFPPRCLFCISAPVLEVSAGTLSGLLVQPSQETSCTTSIQFLNGRNGHDLESSVSSWAMELAGPRSRC